MQRRADLIVGEGAGRVALVRTLEIIVRGEVERRRARDEGPVRADLEGADVGEEGAVRRRSRAAAAVEPRGRGGDLGLGLRGQRAGRIIAAALQDGVELAVGGIGHDVAAAVVEGGAHGEAEVVGAAVGRVAGREAEIAAVELLDDLIAGRIVMLVEAVLGVGPEPLELGVHDEVDDAGDGVRAVDRRCAAGQHIDPAHDRGRDEVDVGDGHGLRRIAGLETAAVDQHQGARGAEVAKIDRRGAGRAVGDVAALAGEGLRQRVDQILGAGRARKPDFLAVEDGDRARRGEVRGNARTGDDDGGVVLVVRLGGFGRTGHGLSVVLRISRRGNADGATDKCGGQQAAQILILPHVGPLKSLPYCGSCAGTASDPGHPYGMKRI